MRERSCTEWLELFEKKSFLSNLKRIYGDSELVKERRDFILKVLKKFAFHFGEEEKVAIVRVPSRVNLMGVHIDHRGGYVNYLTIQKEIIMVASKRTDNKIRGFNIDGRFRPFSFSISALLPLEKRGGWLKFISESKITPGDWANYIKGPILRLQDFTRKELSGMDLVIGGNIPHGSGLSSSSALVVASALTTTAFNDLKISKENLVRLCGEAEWYVGTRGGAGDHAAMLFGKKDAICHIRFFPFRSEYLPFPKGYEVVICNSLKQASKSEKARNDFNQRVATYEIGLRLIKRMYPEIAKKVNHIRDISGKNFKEKEIYKILKSLPERIERRELIKNFPEEKEFYNNLFLSHKEPKDGYHLREVVLFGIGECERSRVSADLLREKRIAEFGRLMDISHNGDRLFWFDKNGKRHRYQNEISNGYLERLIKKTQKLIYQPGAYRCSCQELDLLVDICKNVKGVAGASLTGAGLGGAAVALVRREATKNLLKALEKEYYGKRHLPFAAFRAIPVEGASFITGERRT